jgi:glycosyltransferase involved in cell wall biosynthesis
VEGGVRRAQRALNLPYFAFFDSHRFYAACWRVLPGFALCHEHNGMFSIGAALACRRANIPYVLTVSADPFVERALMGRPLRGIHGAVAAREAQFTYRLARKIICVSEPARRNLIEKWQVDPAKVAVLPNGVDTELFRPVEDGAAVREQFNLGRGPVVAFVGAFHPWHGLDGLIDSFAPVVRQMPEARLLLVGDGRARPQVDRKIKEHRLEPAVAVTGLVAQQRVPEFLAAADVAVLPYPRLPQELWFSPLKLYEYMAAGKAIVASRSGQIAEVIADGQDGLLVEPGDVNELSGVLLRLLGDRDERMRLGQRARQAAVEQHSWQRYIHRLEEVYASVLSS